MASLTEFLSAVADIVSGGNVTAERERQRLAEEERERSRSRSGANVLAAMSDATIAGARVERLGRSRNIAAAYEDWIRGKAKGRELEREYRRLTSSRTLKSLLRVARSPPVRTGPTSVEEVNRWLRLGVASGRGHIPTTAPSHHNREVGIVGAGMSGLYAGLVLQRFGIDVHIFEKSEDRYGGRVYTHRFSDEENQYFEAGAMRLPWVVSQKPVFELIDDLNGRLSRDQRVELIPYNFSDPKGNLVYMNGKKQENGTLMTVAHANQHPEELGFELRGTDCNKEASKLISEALDPLLREFNPDNPGAFFDKYDEMSMRFYLKEQLGWYEDKLNYCELMTEGTNVFQASLVENVVRYDDFIVTPEWKTIKDGMDRLPNACAAAIGRENIELGANVTEIKEENGKVIVTYHLHGSREPTHKTFDKVLLAVPTTVLCMIKRPRWSAAKEQAIRACNYHPLHKVGVQFKSRFWEDRERVKHPTRGGQSVSDLPSHWVVYPSYGIGDRGKGVLLTYCMFTDDYHWIPVSQDPEDLIARVLRDLQELYPEVKIAEEFTGEFHTVNWAKKWATGLALFLPGQFKYLLPELAKSEGNIYFAGEHISVRHGWIVGAIDSAMVACDQILHDLGARWEY